MKKLKVALIHDYLQEFGGAERVVLALHRTFPEAPLYTAFADLEAMGEQGELFKDVDIICTKMENIPLHQRLRSPLRILAPKYFKALDLSEYDVVISSSNAYHAKSVNVPKKAIHLTYCHTPARSLYGYQTRSRWEEKKRTKIPGEIANHFLRMEDWEAAQRVTGVIANSGAVADRVAKFWRRKANIIYPPVEMVDKAIKSEQFLHKFSERSYFVYVNRLNYAKHPELAVQAAIDLGLELRVAGAGPMEKSLAEMIIRAGAEEKIRLLGAVSDEELEKLYAGAKGLIYPVADEDFGIVPVEAMAYGVPVIAHASGGPLETVIDGKTGVFFPAMTIKSLETAIEKAEKIEWDVEVIQAHAAQFSQVEFIRKIRELVEEYAKKS